ncbi:MAG: hypothetical protein AB7E47_12530 [Desulfovibrionaceae bacterium]
MRPVLLVLLLAVAALPLACSHSESFVHEKWKTQQLETDAYNCRWELTHPQAANGTITAVAVPEEQLEAQVRRCLEAKGHDFSKPAEKEDSGWWPW